VVSEVASEVLSGSQSTLLTQINKKAILGDQRQARQGALSHFGNSETQQPVIRKQPALFFPSPTALLLLLLLFIIPFVTRWPVPQPLGGLGSRHLL
jgi:hypothetical protein